jgi:hypothetical protein
MDLMDSLLVTDHTAKTTYGEDQTFCPRHDVYVFKFATHVCRCVLQGAPIEHIAYHHGSCTGVYISGVQCAKPHHRGEDLFSACPLCLGEMLADHPKAQSKADIEPFQKTDVSDTRKEG